MILLLFLLFLYYIFVNKEGFKNNDELEICSTDPMTGYARDGYCNLIGGDSGTHTVCAKVTQRFLEFSRDKGNNLMDKRGSI